MDKLEHQKDLISKLDSEETERHNVFNCANEIQAYTCDGCEYSTQYWVKYIEHLFGTRDDKNFPLDYVSSLICKICEFETFSKYLFMKHTSSGCLEIIHSTDLFIENDTLCCTGSNFQVRRYCDQCSVYYGSVDQFKRHRRRFHRFKDYKWLKCDRCAYQTLWSSCLEAHKASNACKKFPRAEGEWFECNHKCPFKTKRRRCLSVHRFVAHRYMYKCDLCYYTTKAAHRIKYHRSREHYVRDYSDWLECEQCSFKAAGKSNLKKHILSKHKFLDKSQWLLCDQCGLQTKCNSRLLRHQREKHMAGFAGHKCPHCSYTAKQRYHVTLHVTQKHTAPEDLKWFDCAHCPYKAKIKASLKIHLLRKHKSVIENYVV